MVNKHLEAEGKGDISYDYINDMFIFKIKDRDYKKSIEFKNFIIDIDKEDFVTGIRILDASQVIEVEKHVLRNIVQTRFHAQITADHKTITISIHMIGKIRNSLIPLLSGKQNLLQQFSAPINPTDHLSVFEQPITA